MMREDAVCSYRTVSVLKQQFHDVLGHKITCVDAYQRGHEKGIQRFAQLQNIFKTNFCHVTKREKSSNAGRNNQSDSMMEWLYSTRRNVGLNSLQSEVGDCA